MNFEQIHKTAIESMSNLLKELDNKISLSLNSMKYIGKWYSIFFSQQQSVKLHFPFYDNPNDVKIIMEYLKSLNFLFGINPIELKDFENTCLFNFVSHNPSEFNFVEKHNGILKWDDNVFTKSDRFISVWNKDIIAELDSENIQNTKLLFSSIQKTNLINYPVLISPSKKVLLLRNKHNDIEENPLLDSVELEVDRNASIPSLKLSINNLRDISYNHQIILRFPYYSNINYRLINQTKPKFEVIFDKKISIGKLSKYEESDVIVFPNEITSEEQSIKIINPHNNAIIFSTNHSDEIYFLMKEIRQEWKDLNLNKYLYPFPKYFFLFINKGLNVETWLTLFNKAFPAISEHSIFNQIEKLINCLYELDWVKKFVEQRKDEKFAFIFPEITGNKEKRIGIAFKEFKNYVSSFSNKIIFDYGQNNSDIINYSLNSFDPFDIISSIQSGKNYIYLTPDFLYYNYNSFIKYQILKLQIESFFTSLRLKTYPELDTRLANYNEILYKTYNECITELKYYRHSYKQTIEKVEEDIPIDEETDVDIEEVVPVTLSQNIEKIICILSSGTILEFDSTKYVSVLRNELNKVNANTLTKGDLLFDKTQIKDIIKLEQFVLHFTEMPNNILSIKSKLSEILDVYEKLKQRGIDYTDKRYFIKTYANTESDVFKLPRKRINWQIICDFLSINDSDMNIAYISYYGRNSKNRIKELYRKLIIEIIDNDLIGEIKNSETLLKLQNIFRNYSEVFNESEDIEEVFNAIIDSIINHLDKLFFEIKEINYVYE